MARDEKTITNTTILILIPKLLYFSLELEVMQWPGRGSGAEAAWRGCDAACMLPAMADAPVDEKGRRMFLIVNEDFYHHH